VDQELIEYLDRRFNELSTDLRQKLGGELRQELSGFREELRGEFRQGLTGLREELRSDIAASAAELRTEITASAGETRSEIAASAAVTRRHFDVVAEQLIDKIQLVGEGIIGLDQEGRPSRHGDENGVSEGRRALPLPRSPRHSRPRLTVRRLTLTARDER
jgi:AcrR family transcriptional regulator